MNSKTLVAVVALLLLVCVGLGVFFLRGSRQTVVAAPAAAPPTAEQIKTKVSTLNGRIEIGPFGVNLKASAAQDLGDLGQAAKDAGAIPELAKLSKSSQVRPEAREAAKAALAKLNAAAAK